MKKISPKSTGTGTLRNSLIFWFLMFSLVPVVFVTGFSLQKTRSALDKEVFQRILGNSREIEVTLRDLEAHVTSRMEALGADRAFNYYISTSKFSNANAIMSDWLRGSLAARVSSIELDGRISVSVYKSNNGQIVSESLGDDKQIYVAENIIKRLKENPKLKVIDSHANKLELIAYLPIKSKSEKTLGYLEVVTFVDGTFLQSFKNRLGLEVGLMTTDYKVVAATHEDILLYNKSSFAGIKPESPARLMDILIRGEPFGLVVSPSSWGDTKMYLVLAASKAEANKTISNIKTAFLGVLITVVFLVLILTWIASNAVVRPLREVYEGIRRMNQGESGIELPVRGDNEMTYLSASFNEMSAKIKRAQDELKLKIKELETANEETKSAQGQLVHSAKMASLGQLVAGVAHELNNPIGFIYSNMSQLEDYSKKLIQIIDEQEKNIEKANEIKKENDFDYIRDDMPKLIRSCQDGAKRTRDIVLGLRNFSRLEEASLKEADINECLEDTIRLLAGEMKGRIELKKEFGQIPQIMCYPGNLNQVFMNILSNATHAIEGNGTITIRTWVGKQAGVNWVFISIKDTGKGMTKEVKEKIFEPFFSTKTVGQGTGLGMSISFGIIKKHGGEIQVNSEPGKGAEFIIMIPQS